MSTSISPAPPRRTDVKLLAIIVAGVLACGFALAGMILFLTKGDPPGRCGKVNAGSVPDLVKRADISPTFVAFGGNCQFWLAERAGDLVAVKTNISDLGCRVDWKPAENSFFCGEQQVSFAELDYYPTEFGTGAFKGSWIVDFGDAAPPSTQST